MALFTYDEIKACICIILMTGSQRDNFTSLTDLWDPIDGRLRVMVLAGAQTVGKLPDLPVIHASCIIICPAHRQVTKR